MTKNLRSLEWTGGDVAVLASKVANLACLRMACITRRDLAAKEGIKMGERGDTIAVRRDWLIVNVIH